MIKAKNSITICVTVLQVLVCSGAVVAGQPSESSHSGTTILPVVVRPVSAPPGAAVKMRYTWKAEEPTRVPYKVFVHIVDDQWHMVLQDDHTPPVGTSTLGGQGTITYERRFVIPAHIKDGRYRITAGLYEKSKRAILTAGPGVKHLGGQGYEVGTLIVDSNAPWPPADTEKTPSLDLSGYRLTF